MQNLILSSKLNWVNVGGFILVLGIVYTIVKEQSILTSNLITFTFIYTLYLYMKELFRNNIPSSYNKILIFSIVLVFLNVTISGMGDFNYYKKAIMYIATLMLMIYSSSVRITQKTVACAIVVNMLVCILYLMTYQQGFNMFEGEVLLTLNFSNPNQTGMFVVNSLFYILLPLAALKKSLKKFQIAILLALIIPLFLSVNGILTLTGCRSAILSLMLFGALTIMDFILGTRVRFKKWMMAFIAVFPFLFVFIYISYASLLNVDVSFGIENAGKSATTRMHIWKPLIDDFGHYLVCGDYYGISGGTGMSQQHNTHLDIYTSYGIVPLILYMSLMSKILWKTYINATTRFQRASLYAFIACMVVGTFEASFVAGSGGLFILTNGFLLLANSRVDEDFAS